MKKTKIRFFYFLIEKYIKVQKAKEETVSPAVSDSVLRPAAATSAAGNRRWMALHTSNKKDYNSPFCVSFHYCFHWEA